MKKMMLSMAMLLCVGSALGQTAEKLMAKWKAVPGAEYEETTADFRKTLEANKGISKKDYSMVMKSLKTCEQVQLTLDDEQLQALDADIQSLKGYEMLFVQNDNKEPNDSASILGQLWNQAFAPKYQLTVYGKVNGKMISDLLLRWDIWNKVALGHLDCKMPKDKMLAALFNGEMISFDNEEGDEDGNLIDMNKALEEVKNGKALFVINGVEHPYFHSVEEVRNYMISNGIRWDSETWVVGKMVKEKYPHTDRTVVIEYTDTKKERK